MTPNSFWDELNRRVNTDGIESLSAQELQSWSCGIIKGCSMATAQIHVCEEHKAAVAEFARIAEERRMRIMGLLSFIRTIKGDLESIARKFEMEGWNIQVQEIRRLIDLMDHSETGDD